MSTELLLQELTTLRARVAHLEALEKELTTTRLALDEAEAKLRSWVEQSPVLMYLAALGPVFRPLHLGPQVKSLLGLDPAALAQPPRWLEHIAAQDQDKVLEHWRDRAQLKHDSFLIEYRWVTPSGHVLWLRDQACLVRDEHHKPLCFRGVLQDISECVQIQLLCEEQKRRFQYIIKHTPNALAVFDTQMRYLLVSDRFRHDYRLGDQELEGRCHYDVLPEIPEAWREIHRRVLGGEVLSSEEDEFPRLDGSIDYVRWECRPWRDRQGNIGGLILYTEVITERKKVEKALRESERRLSTVVRATPTIIVINTLEEGRYLEVNEAFERITGYSREDVLGRTSHEVGLIHSPSYRDRIINEVHARGTVRDMEVELRGKQGQRIVGLISAVKLEMDGQACLLNVVNDITERKAAEQALRDSEERFRAIFEAAQDAIFIKDKSQRYLQANPAMEKMLGLRAEQLIGHTDAELFGPAPEGQLNADELVLTSGVVQEEYLRFGKALPAVFHVIKVPLRNGSGQIVALCGIARDMTERRRLEEQFRQSQKMETVGRLAGGVAHDFNNLLTAIIGHSGFALDALSEGDPTREDIEQVLRAAERAASLTRQLLAFSRRQIIEPRVVPLNELILNMDKMLRRLIGEDIELVTLPGSHVGLVKVDPGQLEQALVNLVVNARDAMPGGGTLTIETTHQVWTEEQAKSTGIAPGDYAVLTVKDTGVGLSEQVKAHLFEPFFTTKEAGRGTGLGLATVYGIVKQHGGHVLAESVEGKGATFRLLLPRLAESPERVPRRDEAGLLPQGSETVLVVEDEPSVRRIATRVLRELGYTILEASNGEEALRVASSYEGDIDLLLTDVVMPQVGGKALADALRQARPRMAILFVSGYTEDMLVQRGATGQSTAFLQKPFTAALLARKVREVLDRPRLRA